MFKPLLLWHSLQLTHSLFFFFSIESPSKFSTVLVQNTTEAYLVDFTKQGYLVAYVLEDG